jgi:hypothetical protein
MAVLLLITAFSPDGQRIAFFASDYLRKCRVPFERRFYADVFPFCSATKMLRAIQARLRMAMHLGSSRRVKRSVTVDNTSKRCGNYDVQIGRFDYGRS